MLFNFLISAFGLAVRLRVVCSGKGMGDAELVIEGLYDACRKLWAAI